VIARAMGAPGWAETLARVDPKSVNFARRTCQAAASPEVLPEGTAGKKPPLGGFAVTEPGKLKRLLMSPGPIFEPEGHGKDWWNSARALFAAGFRSGDVVHNSFAYHLTPAASFSKRARRRSVARLSPAGSAIRSSRSMPSRN